MTGRPQWNLQKVAHIQQTSTKDNSRIQQTSTKGNTHTANINEW